MFITALHMQIVNAAVGLIVLFQQLGTIPAQHIIVVITATVKLTPNGEQPGNKDAVNFITVHLSIGRHPVMRQPVVIIQKQAPCGYIVRVIQAARVATAAVLQTAVQTIEIPLSDFIAELIIPVSLGHTN